MELLQFIKQYVNNKQTNSQQDTDTKEKLDEAVKRLKVYEQEL